MVEHPFSTRPWLTVRLTALPVRQIAARVDWRSLLAFAVPLLLYRLTLAPTIYNLDSAELTTAVVSNGLLRATGYPLYLVLGKVWSWLPTGADMGFRMNLFSAVCGAATVLLAERILRHLEVGTWARAGALGLLATAPFFWSLSLVAEVYTLHTALMAAIILALLRWADSPTPARLALPVLLMALSLGHHASTVLLLPGAIWFVVTRHPEQLKQTTNWLAAAAGALLGATVFLILPLRYGAQPAFNYAGTFDASGEFLPVNLQSISGLWWLVSGQSFSGQMFGYRLPQLLGQAADYGVQLWRAFFAIGIGPGIAGALVVWRRDRPVAGLLLLMFVANALFFVNYRVVDKATMFLPTYLVWALWLGAGYQLLLDWMRRQSRPHLATRMVTAIILGAVILAAVTNWSLVDLSEDWSTREESQAILDRVEANAIILGWWETIPAIQYLQLVEGQRPDVTAINRFLISPEDMNRFVLSQVSQRPVYVNNPPAELLRATRATAVDSLYRLEVRE